MNIVLSGVSNAGKSTMYLKMMQNDMYEGYEFIPEIIRTIGLDVLKTTPKDEIQPLLYQEQMNRTVFTGNHIYDRGFLDILAYSIYYDNYTPNFYNDCIEQTKKYDCILMFLEPYPFVDDGFRIREDADKLKNIFVNLIKENKLNNIIYMMK